MDLRCYILCADGYIEDAVQEARAILLVERIVPGFLGLKAGTIEGTSGGRIPVEVLISLLIGEGGQRPLPDGLLLAGGAACGQQMLLDPRVHLLVQHMLQAMHPVGFLHPMSYPLFDLSAKNSGDSPFLLSEKRTTAEFMRVFIRHLRQFGQGTALQKLSPLK
ncbi:MAG: hypothetical protein KC415_12745 [Anaerolineales bacterium]|nr:hypothetical protein [Anaerolineales bacterium]MCB8991041.1 hypothetical protein [Ardenticatenaceae bacterium]